MNVQEITFTGKVPERRQPKRKRIRKKWAKKQATFSVRTAVYITEINRIMHESLGLGLLAGNK